MRMPASGHTPATRRTSGRRGGQSSTTGTYKLAVAPACTQALLPQLPIQWHAATGRVAAWHACGASLHAHQGVHVIDTAMNLASACCDKAGAAHLPT